MRYVGPLIGMINRRPEYTPSPGNCQASSGAALALRIFGGSLVPQNPSLSSELPGYTATGEPAGGLPLWEPAREPAAAVRLDYIGSNVPSAGPEPAFHLIGEPCHSRACPYCGPSQGYETRHILLEKTHYFRFPKMLSATVDRDGKTTDRGFESPEAAYRYVRDRKLISKLMARLGVKHWACVLEFQSESGDGWPHWHILIDAKWVDLKLAWYLWKKLWGVGGLDLAKKKRKDGTSSPIKWESREHAINYMTSYLVKPPKAGMPHWLQFSETKVRFLSASKSLGALTYKGLNRVQKPQKETETEPVARDAMLSIYDRLLNCRRRVVVVDKNGAFKTNIDVPYSVLVDYVAENPTPGVRLLTKESSYTRKSGEVVTSTYRQLFATAVGIDLLCQRVASLALAAHDWMLARDDDIIYRWDRYQTSRAALRAGVKLPPDAQILSHFDGSRVPLTPLAAAS